MRGVFTTEQAQFVGIVFMLVAIAGAGLTIGIISRWRSNGWLYIALVLFAMCALWAAWLIPW